MTVRLLDAGDCAVTVEFGTSISREVADRVAACDRALAAALAAGAAQGALAGVVETMPTFRSLTVIYDPLRTSRSTLDPLLLALAETADAVPAAAPRHWRLPVSYGGEHGADLEAVAAAKGLAAAEVIERHAGTDFSVYMIGFMPGFPFMGDLPPALAMPRRREPRLRVPAGSVAIAGALSSIYPWESPGGWSLIGRCPIPLFDAGAERPSLLAPGDRVRFDAVSPARYAEIEAALRAGDLQASACLEVTA